MAHPSNPTSTASSGTFTPSTGFSAPTESSETSTPMTAMTGVPNGDLGGHGANGESSKMASGDGYHASNLAGYLWNVGYIQGQWTDIQIAFFDQSVNLHRIVLSTSPFLASLMAPHPPGSSVHLSFPDPNITPTAVHIALQHLYTPSLHLVDPSNARSVLATAYAFGGMPELVQHAYVVIRDSLDSSNIIDHIHWIRPSLASVPSTLAIDSPIVNGNDAARGGPVFGAFDDSGASSPRSEVSGGWDGGGRYGEWSTRLKEDITEYLIHALPSTVSDPSSPGSDPTFTSIYSALPYDLFKSCIESPDLPMSSTQARFTFAKKVIAQRKKIQAASRGCGPVMEEMVLLAVGTRDGSVEITRRPKRGKTTLVKAGPGVST